MEYSIEKLLEENGFKPVYRKAEYGMYLSPLRIEHDASFKVDYRRNLWFDFGIGRGGNVYTLYMLLKNCSIQEAKSKLSPISDLSNSFLTIKEKKEIYDSPISVVSQDILHSPHLISYLDERKIPYYIARAYCSEIIVKNGEKQHLAIGFKNDSGGWEIRNRYLKLGTSPKTISSIFTAKATDTCNMFEGFMDYLSLVALSDSKGVPGTSIILNSVINLPKSFNAIRQYSNINCYFDNDRAGNEAYNKLLEEFPLHYINDCSKYYRGYKDINDCLVGIPQNFKKEKVDLMGELHLGM